MCNYLHMQVVQCVKPAFACTFAQPRLAAATPGPAASLEEPARGEQEESACRPRGGRDRGRSTRGARTRAWDRGVPREPRAAQTRTLNTQHQFKLPVI